MANQHQLIFELIPRLRRFARAVSGDADMGDNAVKSAIVDALRRPLASQDKERLFCSFSSAIYGVFEMQEVPRGTQPVAANAEIDSSNVVDRLMSLSLPERAAIVLATTEALAYRSIAEIMSIGELAMRAHLTRAREKLCVGRIDHPEPGAGGEGHVRKTSHK